MNFDPQKFFIGLMDFFSILLPGALPTYLLMDEVGPVVLGERYSKLAGAESWARFLIREPSLRPPRLSAGLWADEFYDWARRYMLNPRLRCSPAAVGLLPWLARTLIWLVFKTTGSRGLAQKIKQTAFGALLKCQKPDWLGRKRPDQHLAMSTFS